MQDLLKLIFYHNLKKNDHTEGHQLGEGWAILFFDGMQNAKSLVLTKTCLCSEGYKDKLPKTLLNRKCSGADTWNYIRR